LNKGAKFRHHGSMTNRRCHLVAACPVFRRNHGWRKIGNWPEDAHLEQGPPNSAVRCLHRHNAVHVVFRCLQIKAPAAAKRHEAQRPV